MSETAAVAVAVAGGVSLVVTVGVNYGWQVAMRRKAEAWKRRNFGQRGPG